MIARLFAPLEYWQIPKGTRDSWGCGPGGLGDYLVPDRILGLNVKPACQIHDFYYRHWKDPSEDARSMADRIFKWNMIRILVNTHGKKKVGLKSWIFKIRLWLVGRYYKAVREYGGPAWHDERNKIEDFQEDI